MPIGGHGSLFFKVRVTKERKQRSDKESNMVGESKNKRCWLGLASGSCSCRGMHAGMENKAHLCSQHGPVNSSEQSEPWSREDKALTLRSGCHTYPLPPLAWPQSCRERSPSALLLRTQWQQVLVVMSAQEGAFYPKGMCVS